MWWSTRLKSWRKGHGKPEYAQPERRRIPRATIAKLILHGVCGKPWPYADPVCPHCGPTRRDEGTR